MLSKSATKSLKDLQAVVETVTTHRYNLPVTTCKNLISYTSVLLIVISFVRHSVPAFESDLIRSITVSSDLWHPETLQKYRALIDRLLARHVPDDNPRLIEFPPRFHFLVRKLIDSFPAAKIAPIV